MANAKLSGSLLAYREVPPAPTPAQPPPPSSIASVDQALPNGFRRVEAGARASNGITGGVPRQIGAAAERLDSSPPFTDDNHRFGPIVRFSLAVCGVAASAAIGIGLFIHASGPSGTTVASPAPVAPAAVSSPTPANPATPAAATQATRSDTGTPVSSAQAESPIALAMSGVPAPPAAVSTQPPAAVAAGPAPTPAAPTVVAPLPPEEVAALLARGDALLSSGDIASARLCYETAADRGDAQAALRLGETYDPAFLAQAHLIGARSDPTQATRWYQRALALGATEAQTLLTAVAANDDAEKRSKEMNLLFEQFLARRDGQAR